MNDPTLRIVAKEERGLDVSDITGSKSRQNAQNRNALPPRGPIERIAPIRPRVMEYDIINPVANEGRLRMSQYGKNVVSSAQNRRGNNIVSSPAAGKKKVIAEGEHNIEQIWP